MDPEFRLVNGPPLLRDYLRLRAESGLSPKTEVQARTGLPGSWSAFHVVEMGTGAVVGMGRVIGDGGWYFHVIDMAVLPTFQRRGIGDAVLTALIADVRARAPEGAFINLIADEPGRPLYRRHGFVETAPAAIGMALVARTT